MYDVNSALIAAVLLASMVAALEVGYRLGLRIHPTTDGESRSQINAIQASLLGILALLLGFTFSLSLQRYDSRSEAVVDEANAIGTAYLRAGLLPASVREEARSQLRAYVHLRAEASTVTLAEHEERAGMARRAGTLQGALWELAVRATEEEPNPVRTGLFVQALNDLIDAFGKRNAELDRHVPEVVLFLLYGTFIVSGGIVGYAAGASGHRPSSTTYVMVGLIVLLVFLIVDLDRPRRGLIEVSQESLLELRATIDAPPPP